MAEGRAKILTLGRDDNDRAYYFLVAEIPFEERQAPGIALSIWLDENEPDPGTYKIELSDGRSATGPYHGAEALA